MKIVVQRVACANVAVNDKIVGEIDNGLVVFVGIEQGDTEQDCEYFAAKVANLRIFEDDTGRMNLSIRNKCYSALVISQFTLLGDCKKGNRPNFMKAASADIAKDLFEKFSNFLACFVPVKTGVFQAKMKVKLENDGPVTIIL